MSEHEMRVAEGVARFHLEQSAYALACAVVDAEVWTPAGLVAPDRDALAIRFRAAREAWLVAHEAVRALDVQRPAAQSSPATTR